MPCPVCKAEHTGPCPKMSKPPDTEPLKQLTGWLPGKPPSQTEQEMKAELAKPALMASTLQSFLQKVFQDGTIMKGGDDVAGRIYNLYSDSGGINSSLPAVKTAKQFYLAIWQMKDRHPIFAKGYLQYEQVSLEKMADRCKDPDFTPRRKYFEDFLYFKIGGDAKCRLYLNTKFESIPDILTKIAAYASANNGQVTAFKSGGPYSAPTRADSIVVYCSSKDAAEKLGRTLLASSGSSFNSDVPGMTTRLDPKLGVSTGAEPEPQATGMAPAPEGYPESAQSFGSIRSQLIAMAILNYNENTGVYGKGFDVFARFVCTAFRGYGLDPMQPGD